MKAVKNQVANAQAEDAARLSTLDVPLCADDR